MREESVREGSEGEGERSVKYIRCNPNTLTARQHWYNMNQLQILAS